MLQYTYCMNRVYAQVSLKDVFQPASNFEKIGDVLSVVVQNAFTLAGILFFILIVGAGFGMISGAGSGDPKKMEQGKKALTGAVLGFILILGSFWIMQVIGILTGRNFLPMK